MIIHKRQERQGFAVAVAGTVVATGVRLATNGFFGEHTPFLLMFPVVLVAAWRGGLRPGLLAVALTATASWYFFLPETYSFAIKRPLDFVNLITYCSVSSGIAVVCGLMHRVEMQLRMDQVELKRISDERDVHLERLKVTLTSIGDAVIVTDRDGRVTFLNPVAENLMGYTSDEASGRGIKEVFNIVNEETHEPAFNPVDRVLNEGVVVGLANHTVLISKDGSHYCIEDSAAPICRPGSREVLGCVLVFHDVTEKYERQRQISRNESRLSSLFNHVIDGIITINVHGVIDTFNPAAERIFGYKAEEVIGKNVNVLMPEPYHSAHDDYIASYINGGSPKVIGFGREVEGRRKDGTTFPLDLSVSEFGCNGDRCFTGIVRDMTERKKMEQELRQRLNDVAEAEERMRSVVNHVVDGIISIDERGTILTYNPAAERLFGYTSDEVVGHNVNMLMPEPHKGQHDGYIANYLRTGEAKIIGIGREVEGRRKDGSTFPMELAISTFRLGERRYFTGIVRDITERKRAEQELRDVKQQLQIIIDNAPALISYVDKDKRYRLVNRTYEEWFGTPTQEIIFKSVPEVIGDPAWKEIGPKIEEVLHNGKPMRYEIKAPYVKGTERWISAQYAPHLNQRGEVEGVVVLVTDITERKEAEERLQESETKLKLFVEHAPAAIAMFDREMKYIAVSRRWLDDYCLTGEVLGKNHYDVFKDEMPERWVEAHRRALAGEVMKSEEDSFERKDGSVQWVRWECRPWYAASGEIGGIIIFAVEITERKRLEGELHQRVRDLAEANQRKDEFLAILGHELRNPLAAINNAIQLLTLPNVPDDARLSSGAILKQQIEHVGRLVDDIITVSRAVRGKIEIHRHPVALCEVIERGVQIVEPLIEARRHKLEVKLCNPPITVMGDKIRLVQVVSNLLNNAAKYTHDGGEIRLECYRDGREAVLLVKDNGIGIPPEIMPHIFELCVRGQKATQKDHGMGIGLTMVKTIVELHGGTAVARSDGPDRGAEFTVRLPIMEDMQHEDPTR